LIEMEEMKADGRWDLLSKKEKSRLEKVYRKLSKNLGGIKNMLELPGVLFVIDSTKEEIALLEALKLKIPIVAVVDTNGNPENIDYPIPGNDDAVRAIELFTAKIAETVIEGKKMRIERELLEAKAEEDTLAEGEEGVPAVEIPAFDESLVTEEVKPAEEQIVPKEEHSAEEHPAGAEKPSEEENQAEEEAASAESEKSD
jgi:small subunit ribosomal protein S2